MPHLRDVTHFPKLWTNSSTVGKSNQKRFEGCRCCETGLAPDFKLWSVSQPVWPVLNFPLVLSTVQTPAQSR